MRAEHWYDFWFFRRKQQPVCACSCTHSSGCSSPLSATISKGWTDHAACQTHRWTTDHFLMMSFLRRLALKSVMAAKKESVAKCARLLQYGVGRSEHDDQNQSILRVFVALDLKAAFQDVSRRSMLYSIAQTDADLAAVFSKWYTSTTEHRMHYDSAYIKTSANRRGGSGMPSLGLWILSRC